MGAEAHFGLRRQSEATTALFHSGVILRCIERQVIANAREAEQRKSGVALRFPPHSKNAAPYRLRQPIVVAPQASPQINPHFRCPSEMRTKGSYFRGSSWVNPAPSALSLDPIQIVISDCSTYALELIHSEGAARLPAERI